MISVVIPVFNASEAAVDAIRSCCAVLCDQCLVFEVVVVDDCSSPEQHEALESFAAKLDHNVKIITLPERSGRFVARLAGAQAAIYETILFIDARSQLVTCDTGNLNVSDGCSWIPIVKIDEQVSIFNLHWVLLHKVLYPLDAGQPHVFDGDSKNDIASGTTSLLISRQVFFDQITNHPLVDNPLNDDAWLMEALARDQCLKRGFDFVVNWGPRQDLRSYFQRFYERGPSFVEYHWRNSNSRFSLVPSLIILFFVITLLGLFTHASMSFLALVTLLVFGVAFLTVIMKPKVQYFGQLFFMNLIFTNVFALGVLHGVVKRMRAWN